VLELGLKNGGYVQYLVETTGAERGAVGGCWFGVSEVGGPGVVVVVGIYPDSGTCREFVLGEDASI
jgi:hypothetical protein